MTVRRSTLNLPRQQHRNQVRGFAVVWTGISLLMGAAAFIAIYGGTGILVNNRPALTPAAIAAVPLVTQSATNAPTLGAIASLTALPTETDAVSSAAELVALQVTVTPVPVQPGSVTVTALPSRAPQSAVTATGAAAIATVAATAAVPAPRAALAFDLGIQVQPPPDRSASTHEVWLDMVAKQLKLNWVKHQIRWRDLETTKGKIDFGITDLILPEAQKFGVKVLLSVVTAPDWAREKGIAITADRQGPPADPQDYVNFVTAIVKKYPGAVGAIEVWNEMNLDREWDSPKGLKPDQYVALLKATRDAVKAIDPNILILSGALSPTGASNPPKYYDDFVYMDLLIKAGMLNNADCVGAHHNGYNIGPNVTAADAPRDPKSRTAIFRGPFDNVNHSWSFNSTLSGYASRIKAAGSALKLCITEFGWPSMDGILLNGKKAPAPNGFGFAADNTLANQADYIDQAIDVMSNWGFVQLAFIWNLNYGAQSGWDPKNDNTPYSILGPNFQPRPVWNKIADRNFRGKAQ